MGTRRIRHPAKYLSQVLWPGLLLLAAGACMPLPQEGGVAVSAGAMSDQWVIRVDPVLGTPTLMTNRTLQDLGAPDTAMVSDADAEAAVRAVFDEHPEWFRLRPRVDAFRLVRSYSRGWLRYLRFEQAYKGIPVGGAGYEARVVSNGRVGTIEGRFHSDIAINVTPVLGPDQAEDRARDLFRPGTTPPSLPRLDFESLSRFDGSRALVIVPQGQNYVLAWGVVIQTSPPSIQSTYSRVYIDASTGAPLGVDVAGSSQPRPR